MKTSYKKESLDELLTNGFIYCGIVLFAIFGMGAFHVKRKLEKDHFFIKKIGDEKKKKILIDSLIVSLLVSFVATYLTLSHHLIFVLLFLIPMFYFGFSLGLYIVPKYFGGNIDYRILPKHTNAKIKNINSLEGELLNPRKAPVGISLTTRKPVHIDAHIRNEHTMITGSTGVRKSSVAITMRKSDYIHNRPVIDIDPKGSNEDITTMKTLAELYGRKDDFLHFNISDPINSWGYDPLEIGSKRSKVDKVIYALGLNHEHYAGLAEDFISLIFDVCDVLNINLSISKLAKLVISKELLYETFEKVYQMAESDEKENLILRISVIKSLKSDDLKGIKSKLNALAAMDLYPILNPKPEKKINLIDVITTNKIAYFQLNTMEFKSLNKTIARFIISDLEIVASQLSSGTLQRNSDFVAVYLDEALSFMDQNFPEYSRMVRDAKVSVTIIFQTLAKLDEFGDSFKHQLLNETKTSLHFETDSPPDIETITLIPGTITTKQSSSAIDKKQFFSHIGRGTESDSEVKKVNANVMRTLKKGQCLFYDREHKYYDVIETWSAKDPRFVPKSLKELRETSYVIEEKVPLKSLKMNEKEKYISKIHPQDYQDLLTYSDMSVARDIRTRWNKQLPL